MVLIYKCCRFAVPDAYARFRATTVERLGVFLVARSLRVGNKVESLTARNHRLGRWEDINMHERKSRFLQGSSCPAHSFVASVSSLLRTVLCIERTARECE